MPGDIDAAIKLYWTKAYPIKTIVIGGNIITFAFNVPGHKTGNEHFYKSPPVWTGGETKMVLDNGLLSIHEVERYKKLTQVIDNNDRAVRIARRKARRWYPYIYFYMCKAWQVFDIDYPDEFDLAEILFQHYILDKGHYQ